MTSNETGFDPANVICKWYSLNSDACWDDMGKCYVSVISFDGEGPNNAHRGEYIVLESYNERSHIMLSSKILQDDIYRRRESIYIEWCDGSLYETSLSFEYEAGCSFIWDAITAAQRALRGASREAATNGMGLEGFPVDRDAHASWDSTADICCDRAFLGSFGDFSGNTSTSLMSFDDIAACEPTPDRLVDISASLLRLIEGSSKPRAAQLVGQILSPGSPWLHSLCHTFASAEEIGDMTTLEEIARLTSRLITAASPDSLLELLVRPYFADLLIGFLEMDPCLPKHMRVYHRHQIRCVMERLIVPGLEMPPDVISLIECNYRVAYLKDTVLARSVDEMVIQKLHAINNRMMLHIAGALVQMDHSGHCISRLFLHLSSDKLLNSHNSSAGLPRHSAGGPSNLTDQQGGPSNDGDSPQQLACTSPSPPSTVNGCTGADTGSVSPKDTATNDAPGDRSTPFDRADSPQQIDSGILALLDEMICRFASEMAAMARAVPARRLELFNVLLTGRVCVAIASRICFRPPGPPLPLQPINSPTWHPVAFLSDGHDALLGPLPSTVCSSAVVRPLGHSNSVHLTSALWIICISEPPLLRREVVNEAKLMAKSLAKRSLRRRKKRGAESCVPLSIDGGAHGHGAFISAASRALPLLTDHTIAAMLRDVIFAIIDPEPAAAPASDSAEVRALFAAIDSVLSCRNPLLSASKARTTDDLISSCDDSKGFRTRFGSAIRQRYALDDCCIRKSSAAEVSSVGAKSPTARDAFSCSTAEGTAAACSPCPCAICATPHSSSSAAVISLFVHHGLPLLVFSVIRAMFAYVEYLRALQEYFRVQSPSSSKSAPVPVCPINTSSLCYSIDVLVFSLHHHPISILPFFLSPLDAETRALFKSHADHNPVHSSCASLPSHQPVAFTNVRPTELRPKSESSLPYISPSLAPTPRHGRSISPISIVTSGGGRPLDPPPPRYGDVPPSHLAALLQLALRIIPPLKTSGCIGGATTILVVVVRFMKALAGVVRLDMSLVRIPDAPESVSLARNSYYDAAMGSTSPLHIYDNLPIIDDSVPPLAQAPLFLDATVGSTSPVHHHENSPNIVDENIPPQPRLEIPPEVHTPSQPQRSVSVAPEGLIADVLVSSAVQLPGVLASLLQLCGRWKSPFLRSAILAVLDIMRGDASVILIRPTLRFLESYGVIDSVPQSLILHLRSIVRNHGADTPLSFVSCSASVASTIADDHRRASMGYSICTALPPLIEVPLQRRAPLSAEVLRSQKFRRTDSMSSVGDPNT